MSAPAPPDAPADANQGCVGPSSDSAGKAAACEGCPNKAACSSGQMKNAGQSQANVADNLKEVKHKIVVLSGKGGVGKSTVASQLAWMLSERKEVGLLDIDVCGPSGPRMTGVEAEEVHRSLAGWCPVLAGDRLSVMSVGFMLENRSSAVVWAGPRRARLIEQFMTEVDWGQLDFLVIDAPPGTGDEVITATKLLSRSNPDGALIVTTPQEVALLDVRKEITFCRKVGLPILGVIQNMAGLVCEKCGHKNPVFCATTGGAEALCAEMGVRFLGEIPHDPLLGRACEEGKNYAEQHPRRAAAVCMTAVLKTLLNSTPALKATFEAQQAQDGEPAE